MVDKIEVLSKNKTFTWYKVILHRAHARNYLTYMVGADDIGSAKEHYSAIGDYAIVSIAAINSDGSSRDAEEWKAKERYLFIKSICGSYYTPDETELQAIDGLLDAHREDQRKQMQAAIKSYTKTGDLTFSESSYVKNASI